MFMKQLIITVQKRHLSGFQNASYFCKSWNIWCFYLRSSSTDTPDVVVFAGGHQWRFKRELERMGFDTHSAWRISNINSNYRWRTWNTPAARTSSHRRFIITRRVCVCVCVSDLSGCVPVTQSRSSCLLWSRTRSWRTWPRLDPGRGSRLSFTGELTFS